MQQISAVKDSFVQLSMIFLVSTTSQFSVPCIEQLSKSSGRNPSQLKS